MAKITNSSTRVNLPVMYPYGSTKGSALTQTTPAGTVPMFVLPATALGVYNSSGTDVFVNVIPTGNDHTAPVLLKVPAWSAVRVCAFEAVLPTSSVGHLLSTTEYLTGYDGFL